MQVATEKYRCTDISGNYADLAKAFGGYGERVTAARRDRPGDQARRWPRPSEGVPALLEFITEKAEDFSMFA